MNVQMTKEDFKLLLDMYNEAFDMVILKKHFKVEISSRYNAKKYMELKGKLLNSADEQKIEESEIEFDENNFSDLAKKIAKDNSELKEILNLKLKELFSVEEFQEEMLSMAKDFFEKNKRDD